MSFNSELLEPNVHDCPSAPVAASAAVLTDVKKNLISSRLEMSGFSEKF